MAPEQATADPHVDHRADIYAVRALAYEMLTVRPPFTGSSPQAVLAAQGTQTPEPVTRYRASVPQTLAALVMRCLEKRHLRPRQEHIHGVPCSRSVQGLWGEVRLLRGLPRLHEFPYLQD
jgi:serine/threonine protein kinase